MEITLVLLLLSGFQEISGEGNKDNIISKSLSMKKEIVGIDMSRTVHKEKKIPVMVVFMN